MSAGQNARDLSNDPGLDLATLGLQGSPGLNAPSPIKSNSLGEITNFQHKLSMELFQAEFHDKANQPQQQS